MVASKWPVRAALYLRVSTGRQADNDLTRAPILIKRSRMVANSQPASGLVRGIAARTPFISQNAAV